MYRPDYNPQFNANNVVLIGKVVLIIEIVSALLVGGLVYWWQRSSAEQEQEILLKQVNQLQNEIKILKEDFIKQEKGSSNLAKLKPKNSAKNPKNASNLIPKLIENRSTEVLLALKDFDPTRLAALANPEKGIRFSPYSYVDLKKDVVLLPDELKTIFKNNRKLLWGYSDRDGLPIKLTPLKYFQTYVYDRDYAKDSEIEYSRIDNQGLTANNSFEAYPNSIIVEYHFSGYNRKEQELDWKSLKLVFEESNQVWYLVGIIHDQWMI